MCNRISGYIIKQFTSFTALFLVHEIMYAVADCDISAYSKLAFAISYHHSITNRKQIKQAMKQ